MSRNQIESQAPPHSVLAEQQVIGCCLLSKAAISQAAEKLAPQHFYRDVHRLIFEAVIALYAKGAAVDIATVSEELHRTGTLKAVGGTSLLMDILQQTASAANVQHHVAIVLENAMKREILRLAREYSEKAMDAGTDALQVLSDFQGETMLIGRSSETSTLYKPMRLAGEVFRHIDAMLVERSSLTGVPTGLRDLDFITGGLHPSTLTVIGARPSVGKTALIASIAGNIAQAGTPVAFFSIEMSAVKIGMRIFKQTTGIPVDSYQFLASHTSSDVNDVAEGIRTLQSLPFFVDEKADISLPEMMLRARRMVEEFGCKVIFCDYLQIIREHESRRRDVREFISQTVIGMKTLARMLNVPVVLLSQLTRDVEKQASKRPEMHHLMEAGAIEAAADVIVLIHRPETYGITMFDDAKYLSHL